MTAPHVDVRVATPAEPAPPMAWASLPEGARERVDELLWIDTKIAGFVTWQCFKKRCVHTHEPEWRQRASTLLRLIEAVERYNDVDAERVDRFIQNDKHAFDAADPSRWERWLRGRAS
jgi:hypothetical protein